MHRPKTALGPKRPKTALGPKLHWANLKGPTCTSVITSATVYSCYRREPFLSSLKSRKSTQKLVVLLALLNGSDSIPCAWPPHAHLHACMRRTQAALRAVQISPEFSRPHSTCSAHVPDCQRACHLMHALHHCDSMHRSRWLACL